MNVQAQMSGQISGQVPSQAGSQLPGLAQQNGSSVPNQRQSLGGHRNAMNMGPEVLNARKFMQHRILQFILQRAHQTRDTDPKKIQDAVRTLEVHLWNNASSTGEYLNMATLENRLMTCIQNQKKNASRTCARQGFGSSSSSIGTMIPTPGMPYSGNSNSMNSSSAASGSNSIAPATGNGRSLLSNINEPLVGIQGPMANGYPQVPANFSTRSSANNIVSSIREQRMTSQMIPTPGFNNTNTGAASTAESPAVSQPQERKQLVRVQNTRTLQSLGSNSGSRVMPGLQQRSCGLQNGVLNGGPRRIRGPLTGSETSEGYQLAAPYGNSPKLSQPQHDQHQLTMPQGDVYKMSAPDSSGNGNVFGPVTSTSSAPNNQKLNSANLSSTSTNSSLKANQLNLNRSQQAAHILSRSTDTSNKLNFQCANTLQKNLLQSNQQDLCRQPHSSLQQQFIHDQSQQKPQNQQHEALVKNEPFTDSEFTSNLSNQLKPDRGMQCNSNDLLSKVSEQFQRSDLRNELLLSSAADHSRGSQMVSLPPIVQHIPSSTTQTSHQMQLLHSQEPAVISQDDSSYPSAGLKEVRPLSDQRHTKSQEGFELPVDMVHEQHLQEDFRRRITVRDEAQRNNLSSETSTCQVTTETAKPASECKNISRSGDPIRGSKHFRQIKWILLLSHARNCSMPEGKCPERHCLPARQFLRHMESCNLSQCPRPHCNNSRDLLRHKRLCQDPVCVVCSTVKKVKENQMKLRACADSKPDLPCSASSQCNTYDGGVAFETSDDAQHSFKRLKTEQSFQSLLPGNETSATFIRSSDVSPVFHDTQHQDYQQGDSYMSMKAVALKVKSVVPSNTGCGNSSITDLKKESMDYAYNQNPVGKQIVHGESFTAQQECIKVEADLDQSKPRKCNPGYGNISSTELKKESMDYTYNQNSVGQQIIHGDSFSAQQECIKVETDLDQSKPSSVALPAETGSVIMSGKPKIKGVSMMELFTPEQVREHMMSLRQWVGQTKTKAEKNQAMGHSMNENSCQLCAVERLAFEPPPIYCTPCGARIKRNSVYYTVGSGETRNCFCIPCSSDTRGDTILVDGTAMSRERLERKKNDEETEEAWVQCDKCEAWQHQICALFNWRRNDGGQAEYTCPNCYLAEVEKGERTPLPQTAVLGAKDLPRTILSDHIEERLFRRLKQERQERARLQGRSYDEVPGAEALVIRVVSSVDKKLEVKQQFLEIFKENYPTEFQYKSKVVLLFQKIEGVEVCLFGMYVQEFGSECQQPNHRRVYLSYLDSVKYFRPDIKAMTGEALRTFVYHEILIGYLEYCKKRGFASCYIWACPPLKGEDYILYCHPEIQKTPKSDKLREWYLSMLRKASKENIVVDVMNLYDNFFVTTGERKAKVTASRLPYFDGDYWPGAAEEMIYQLRQEEDGRKQQKRGTIKKTLTKRALRASGQYDLSGNASIDLLLMHKLGETINPMKEDFIMVHLQHACTHCGILMVSGNRWVCKQCKNFQLCDKCYQSEQKVEDRERHPINQKDKHLLHQIEINDVPEETRDKDNILESEFFDTRQAFLSLCQGNHYQYDTLRRAKHSSMMVLYHLHNPTAPAFATTCNICQLDVEAGQGWRCEVCPDYDVCNTCYQRDGGINHPHKLAHHPSMADCDAQNGEAREMRVAQLKKMLELLVHASHCRSTTCQYPNCRRVKGLFRHGIHCKIRASGGCKTCQKMWHLLQLHARACKVSECTVPRCRDLKVHLRRAQQHSESRRRQAVKEMMRQRTAEVAGNAR